MFRALLCPSSRAPAYNVDYHIGRFVLGLLYFGGEVRLGWSSVRAPARSLFTMSKPCRYGSTILIYPSGFSLKILCCKKIIVR